MAGNGRFVLGDNTKETRLQLAKKLSLEIRIAIGEGYKTVGEKKLEKLQHELQQFFEKIYPLLGQDSFLVNPETSLEKCLEKINSLGIESTEGEVVSSKTVSLDSETLRKMLEDYEKHLETEGKDGKLSEERIAQLAQKYGMEKGEVSKWIGRLEKVAKEGAKTAVSKDPGVVVLSENKKEEVFRSVAREIVVEGVSGEKDSKVWEKEVEKIVETIKTVSESNWTVDPGKQAELGILAEVRLQIEAAGISTKLNLSTETVVAALVSTKTTENTLVLEKQILAASSSEPEAKGKILVLTQERTRFANENPVLAAVAEDNQTLKEINNAAKELTESASVTSLGTKAKAEVMTASKTLAEIAGKIYTSPVVRAVEVGTKELNLAEHGEAVNVVKALAGMSAESQASTQLKNDWKIATDKLTEYGVDWRTKLVFRGVDWARKAEKDSPEMVKKIGENVAQEGVTTKSSWLNKLFSQGREKITGELLDKLGGTKVVKNMVAEITKQGIGKTIVGATESLATKSFSGNIAKSGITSGLLSLGNKMVAWGVVKGGLLGKAAAFLGTKLVGVVPVIGQAIAIISTVLDVTKLLLDSKVGKFLTGLSHSLGINLQKFLGDHLGDVGRFLGKLGDAMAGVVATAMGSTLAVTVIGFLLPSVFLYFFVTNVMETSDVVSPRMPQVAGLGGGPGTGRVTGAGYTGPAIPGCPSIWPATGAIIQGPGGAFSHTSLQAIDIAGGESSPILATTDGHVEAFYDNTPGVGYGVHAVLSATCNGTNYQIYYGHFTKDCVIKAGPVKRGDVIGCMGTTGFSTLVHLHYEIRGLGDINNYLPKAVPRGCYYINDQNKKPCNMSTN